MRYISIISIVLSQVCMASATDFAIRVLLNKGASLPTGETCNEEEWSSILSTIDSAMSYNERNLRSLNGNLIAWCEQKCEGFTPGTCVGKYKKCNGFRELKEQDNNNTKVTAKPFDLYKSFRNLFTSTTCQGQIGEINTALSNLEPTLSTQCQAVLNSQREFTCLANVEDCDIQRIRLMNADTDTVMVDDFKSGMSFRRFGPRVTFEAINDSCVCNVQFIIKNSAGQIIHSRFEFYRPFVAFSNSLPNAQGVVDLFGSRFSVGSYTLEYYPDKDTSKMKTIAFTVTS